MFDQKPATPEGFPLCSDQLLAAVQQRKSTNATIDDWLDLVTRVQRNAYLHGRMSVQCEIIDTLNLRHLIGDGHGG